MDIKKFVQDTQELEQEIQKMERHASYNGAVRVIVTIFGLLGVVYPWKTCFCETRAVSDEEVRNYYITLFGALRGIGLTEDALRSIMARHQYADTLEGFPLHPCWKEKLDPLDVESWVTRRERICGCTPESWAGLVANHIL